MAFLVTDKCLSMYRYNSHTFIDVTSRSIPHYFPQFLVPCILSLIRDKGEYLYCNLFHELIDINGSLDTFQ
ncbi:hypothetical protein HZS_687 [Henneguya salminicola]|nr:hypothetical protein HZS_687 [Henneguya salminicola]